MIESARSRVRLVSRGKEVSFWEREKKTDWWKEAAKLLKRIFPSFPHIFCFVFRVLSTCSHVFTFTVLHAWHNLYWWSWNIPVWQSRVTICRVRNFEGFFRVFLVCCDVHSLSWREWVFHFVNMAVQQTQVLCRPQWLVMAHKPQFHNKMIELFQTKFIWV